MLPPEAVAAAEYAPDVMGFLMRTCPVSISPETPKGFVFPVGTSLKYVGRQVQQREDLLRYWLGATVLGVRQEKATLFYDKHCNAPMVKTAVLMHQLPPVSTKGQGVAALALLPDCKPIACADMQQWLAALRQEVMQTEASVPPPLLEFRVEGVGTGGDDTILIDVPATDGGADERPEGVGAQEQLEAMRAAAASFALEKAELKRELAEALALQAGNPPPGAAPDEAAGMATTAQMVSVVTAGVVAGMAAIQAQPAGVRQSAAEVDPVEKVTKYLVTRVSLGIYVDPTMISGPAIDRLLTMHVNQGRPTTVVPGLMVQTTLDPVTVAGSSTNPEDIMQGYVMLQNALWADARKTEGVVTMDMAFEMSQWFGEVLKLGRMYTLTQRMKFAVLFHRAHAKTLGQGTWIGKVETAAAIHMEVGQLQPAQAQSRQGPAGGESQPRPKRQRSKGGSSERKRQARPKGFCFAYSDQSKTACAYPGVCTFRHECASCMNGKDHYARNCPKWDAAAAAKNVAALSAP